MQISVTGLQKKMIFAKKNSRLMSTIFKAGSGATIIFYGADSLHG